MPECVFHLRDDVCRPFNLKDCADFGRGSWFAALVEGGGGSGFRATMLDSLPRPVLSFLGRPVFYLFSPLHTKH